jgi:glycerol kinase
MHDVLEMMNRDTAVPLHAIHVDGRATRNALLMQFIADIIRLNVITAQMSECSPLGPSLGGAVGMGTLDMAAIATMPGESVRYAP